MFKRLYAIGAHEDFFSPPTRRTRFSPRFGTASTKAWYRQYHTVVLRVPHRGNVMNFSFLNKQMEISTIMLAIIYHVTLNHFYLITVTSSART